jgi:hypothetical protein
MAPAPAPATSWCHQGAGGGASRQGEVGAGVSAGAAAGAAAGAGAGAAEAEAAAGAGSAEAYMCGRPVADDGEKRARVGKLNTARDEDCGSGRAARGAFTGGDARYLQRSTSDAGVGPDAGRTDMRARAGGRIK